MAPSGVRRTGTTCIRWRSSRTACGCTPLSFREVEELIRGACGPALGVDEAVGLLRLQLRGCRVRAEYVGHGWTVLSSNRGTRRNGLRAP